jgi:hypothetical protein
MAVKTMAIMAIKMLVNHMAPTSIAEYPVGGHGRRRLDHDDAVKNQVPKRERSAKPQAWRGGGSSTGRSSFHSRVVDAEESDVNESTLSASLRCLNGR